jgi:hypothetical protein
MKPAARFFLLICGVCGIGGSLSAAFQAVTVSPSSTTAHVFSPATLPPAAALPFSFWKSGAAPTATATATATATPTPGPNSFSLLFNGSTQYVTIPNTPVTVGSNFTIEAWIKVATAGNGNVIFSGSSGSNYFMLINRNDANGLCVQIEPGSGLFFVGGSSANITVADGWTHVAVTRSGNTFSFYKNGTLLKTGTYSGSAPTTNQRIAQLPIGTNLFNGRIDEVRTWNVARTAADIDFNKVTVLTGTETGLTGYWRFEDGSGSTATDTKTPSGNNGTLVASPTWSTDKPF